MKKNIGRTKKAAAAAMLLALAAAAAGCGNGSGGNEGAGEMAGAERAEKAEGEEKAEGAQKAAEAPAAGKDSVVVVMNPESEPAAGFDPAYGWGAGEHVHEPLIQSTLTVTNQDLTIGYDLATAVEAAEDGMTWTVSIRDDAYFTDGEKLTAEDVAFTYNTVKKTSSVNDFTMLEYAEARDPQTVVFHMERPYSIWPYTMAVVGIVPEHAYSENYGQNPVGSGRYKLVQWDKGQQVILEANPDYYGGEPEMKKVTVLFMAEDAAFAAVMSGQADVVYTAASYGEQQVPGYQLMSVDTVDNRGFNLPAVPYDAERGIGNNFTCHVEVRRAISMAIDRQALIGQVLNGFGSPAYSVCDKMPWYNDAAEAEGGTGNLPAAEKLLDDSGWIVGGDGVRSRDGVRAELTFLYPAGDSVRQALAAATADQLKALGIDAKTEGVGWDTAYDRAQTDPLMWGWGAHSPMELYNIYHRAPGSDYAQYSPYANDRVDEYMDQAMAASDLERSYELWKMAQWDGETGVTLEGDIPWVWLVNVDHLYWVRQGLKVAEQKIHPHGHGWSIVNNVDRWTWE